MQEVIEILMGATKLLREVEALKTFRGCSRVITAKVYLVHGSLELALVKLHLLDEQKEETTEEAQNDSGRGDLGG